jgi:acetyltransferase-like isoleucine patch superfamily enzyme
MIHELHPTRRSSGKHETAAVEIGNNVFIGSRVTVLKGVVIGDNSVIANGSIVIKDVPSNVVAGGIPAKVIRTI